ncbi:MAG: MBL fold metallo-hydrolase [Gammaproteobacteria bacterium]|nr:MBL fold metallo-hydrolase [Gammaproteobacteria bacterium]
MKVCIHRGTKEIGGTCVEIEAQGKSLVLDVGLPLDASDPDDIPLHPVKGFAAPDASLLGVVISHPHQDHYGLAYRLPGETPFLIGKAAEAILDAATLFSPSGLKLKNVKHLADRTPIVLGPFTITPFLVDHSAYDSYAVLVEAEGKRLFYTGDFRAHGRKASLTDRLIDNPPKNVDILLMEGTCIGREDKTHRTEDDLVPQFADIFKKTPGMPLVWCSGQNIDRIVTIFKACIASKRQFIVDMYTAEILRATDNPRLPQADWNGIKVFLPTSQWLRLEKEETSQISDSYLPYRISSKALARVASQSVMLFRPSMVRDLERAECLKDGCVVCSVWDGYLEGEKNQWFVKWMAERGLLLHPCHTSGHASVPDLRRMRNAFPGAVAVPVHLQDQERFKALFANVRQRDDGEWWGV